MTRRKMLVIGSTCLPLAAVGGTLAARLNDQCHPDSRAEPFPHEDDTTIIVRLDGSTTRRTLATVAAGSRSEMSVFLLNPASGPVRVTGVGTSCECFRVEVPQRNIAGGGQVPATVALDFAHEPGFRGNLLLVAEGFSAEGRRLFTIQLDVSVR